MKLVGLICDLKFTRHPIQLSYYHSITSLYQNVKDVKNVKDLDDIELLFIGDEHFGPNNIIWKNINFINKCNELNIKVIVFNNERIMDSFFPWNVQNQEYVNKFNNLYQYVSDIDDVIKLNKKFNRMPPSKFLKNVIGDIEVSNKLNKAVFIGNTSGNSYAERRKILQDINQIIEVDIIKTDNNRNWENYVKKMAEYRFVISPLGNAHFFPMRFYEILLARSIPIQQIKSNTLDYYDIESKFDDCIFFENIEELKDKIDNFKLNYSHNMLWQEDNIENLLTGDNLLL